MKVCSYSRYGVHPNHQELLGVSCQLRIHTVFYKFSPRDSWAASFGSACKEGAKEASEASVKEGTRTGL
jgi:hypothetical protein